MVWFNERTFESNVKFELIGILVGMAIYNGVILDIHLPLACYKKLLNINPTIEDLKELSKIGPSLEYILTTEDENLESALYQPFIIEEDIFGENVVTELKEGGASIFVNQENKHEYVDLVIDHIFNKSMAVQFDNFYQGF